MRFLQSRLSWNDLLWFFHKYADLFEFGENGLVNLLVNGREHASLRELLFEDKSGGNRASVTHCLTHYWVPAACFALSWGNEGGGFSIRFLSRRAVDTKLVPHDNQVSVVLAQCQFFAHWWGKNLQVCFLGSVNFRFIIEEIQELEGLKNGFLCIDDCFLVEFVNLTFREVLLGCFFD